MVNTVEDSLEGATRLGKVSKSDQDVVSTELDSRGWIGEMNEKLRCNQKIAD